MKQSKNKQLKRIRRQKRVRSNLLGRQTYPRLSVYRSNRHLYVQLINDLKGTTLVSASDKSLDNAKQKGNSNVKIAEQLGKLIAQRALKKKIVHVIFDRGCFKYHGQVKALADGAREGGLIF
ncbi:MAG: 50S ribosomal protein L18 [Candidatus Aenigmarchaeota archaeon]|nr:50S ribosomal protein L18 [Candidatus Aenigmarchaeota archaeon]